MWLKCGTILIEWVPVDDRSDQLCSNNPQATSNYNSYRVCHMLFWWREELYFSLGYIRSLHRTYPTSGFNIYGHIERTWLYICRRISTKSYLSFIFNWQALLIVQVRIWTSSMHKWTSFGENPAIGSIWYIYDAVLHCGCYFYQLSDIIWQNCHKANFFLPAGWRLTDF